MYQFPRQGSGLEVRVQGLGVKALRRIITITIIGILIMRIFIINNSNMHAVRLRPCSTS